MKAFRKKLLSRPEGGSDLGSPSEFSRQSIRVCVLARDVQLAVFVQLGNFTERLGRTLYALVDSGNSTGRGELRSAFSGFDSSIPVGQFLSARHHNLFVVGSIGATALFSSGNTDSTG